MIHVAGGIYFEVCWEGDWNQLYGSGLRAAATLSSMGAPVTLSGYVASTHELAARAAANAVGVAVDLHAAPQTVTFEYEHSLATPVIDPPLHLIAPGDVIHVAAKTALRFGMVDGDAVVRAAQAVYDPQSAYRPAFFRSNGSTAERLAVVCNRREATLLTGITDVDAAIKLIAEQDQAAVVVVKQGARGARVYANGLMSQVPAFRTSTVWPIGSGDVFSAVFTQAWAFEGASAVDAARRASLGTAWYCDSRSLPTVALLNGFNPAEVRNGAGERPLVYLAAPFFNMMQRWMIRQARTALADAGMRVFSPFHDVGHGVAEDVADKDLKGLEQSAAVFAMCDGLDSGTLFEIGYARKMGIPVVAFVQSETEESLKMLLGSGCDIVHDFATAIYRLRWMISE